MIRPAIDKNDIVIGAKLTAQVGRSHDAPAPTTQNYDPFPSIQ
jgi:hypothetical protein